MTQYRALLTILFTALLSLSGNIVCAQYGVDQQIQFANEALERTRLRVESNKAKINDTVREVTDKVTSLTGPIFDANFNCEKRAYKFDKTANLEEFFKLLSDTVGESGRTIDRIKDSIDSKVDIATRSKDRMCYKGSEGKLEPYLNCLFARERLSHVLNYAIGIVSMQVTYKLFITDQVEKYTACSRKEGGFREQDFLEVGKRANGIGAMLRIQADTMNKAAAEYLSISF